MGRLLYSEPIRNFTRDLRSYAGIEKARMQRRESIVRRMASIVFRDIEYRSRVLSQLHSKLDRIWELGGDELDAIPTVDGRYVPAVLAEQTKDGRPFVKFVHAPGMGVMGGGSGSQQLVFEKYEESNEYQATLYTHYEDVSGGRWRNASPIDPGYIKRADLDTLMALVEVTHQRLEERGYRPAY